MTVRNVEPPTVIDGATEDDQRIAEAIEVAASLLRSAARHDRHANRAERGRRKRMAAIVGDPTAQSFTMAMTDEVVRIGDDRRAARRLADLVRELSFGTLGFVDGVLLHVGGRVARIAPKPVMRLVDRRLRAECATVVLPSEDGELSRHLERRRHDGMRSNVNVLGEAILSDVEAAERLDLVDAFLSRPDVDYLSVKISAICAHVSVLAFDATVEEVATAVRRLLRTATARVPAKFVNLDMEEYRDLDLTTAVFRRVLDEPEFLNVSAGIVLQAYLPDSHGVAHELCEWARRRVADGGAPIKIRLVKGANLAMEVVEAELHGWTSAPFATKHDVDASYKRLLDVMLQPAYDGAVRVGLASHNLFDVAWGLVLRDGLDERRQADRLEFEMLEGMAPAQANAVKDRAGSLLLYSPIVARDDFPAAIAYLVRRLDENTAPDNFLTALFDITPDNDVFRREAEKFASAVRHRNRIDVAPRRRQDRQDVSVADVVTAPFRNEPDTDFTSCANREWIAKSLADWHPIAAPPAADVAAVDNAVAVAVAAQRSWAAVSGPERARVVNRIGDVVTGRRGEILATMANEAGKTIAEGDPEVSEAIDFARYYARSISAIDRLALDVADSEPLGTVVVTPPWNFPFAIALGGVVAALAAGNTVILKPPPQSVQTACLVAQVCWAAGISGEVLQFVAAPDDDAGRRLITHPDVDAVILTGAGATARMFLDWRPSLRLHAETSGKNAMVITATADVDTALRDLVRSAFGHAGQKCSAASLAIVEASLYDDTSFRDRLRDAVETLRVGHASDFITDVGPLIGPPSGDLVRALTVLDPGEAWLTQPRCLDGDRLWTPGVRIGVRPGSWFARTECFGPVLGVMRANDLDHAIAIQNSTDFGLTAGLHALDPAEITTWCERVEAGNLYVNRGTTGAIVERQPFGGWKQSVVGPTAKAGGPAYVSSFRNWPASRVDSAELRQLDERFAEWAHSQAQAEHDPAGLRAESNVYRFRPLARGVVVRVGPDAPVGAETIARAAAKALGVQLIVSSAATEDDVTFAARLSSLAVDRLRIAGSVSDDVRRAAHERSIVVDERPLLTNPQVELPRWLLEQAVSRTRHRHGRLDR